jgi:hypothetical protein
MSNVNFMPYVFPAPTTTNTGIYSHIIPSFVDKNKKNGSLLRVTQDDVHTNYELDLPNYEIYLTAMSGNPAHSRDKVNDCNDVFQPYPSTPVPKIP